MLYVPEGQPISASHHDGNVFWDVFKGCQQSGNLRIVAFAAYGYNGAWDCSASATRTMDVSPYLISPENTWGLDEARFTEVEYKDYISRFSILHLGDLEDTTVKSLEEYVGNTTGRHPGVIAFFMNQIKNHFCSKLKYGQKLTFERIFLYLKSFAFQNAVDTVSNF
jgi:hypothetical protein